MERGILLFWRSGDSKICAWVFVNELRYKRMSMYIANTEFQETCRKPPIVPYTFLLFWHLKCYDGKGVRGGTGCPGITFAIRVFQIFVLSEKFYMITLNETEWEVMCQVLGGLTVAVIMLMMFGPLILDLVRMMQEEREAKK